MNRLCELLRPSPQMKILAVTSRADHTVAELCAFLEGHNGEMDLSFYPGEHAEYSSPIIGRTDRIKDYRSPLRVATRDYEAAVVQDILHLHDMPLKLLQLIYRAMENSAEIIVVQTKGTIEPEAVESLLEQSEFRAANTIGDLIDNYDVIVAKKMHMCGNGL